MPRKKNWKSSTSAASPVITSKRAPLPEVSGTVTHSGKPVPFLFVKFETEQGTGAWATADQHGRFSLWSAGDREGAVPGEYRVWVEHRPSDGGMDPGRATAGPDPLEAIYAKYGRESSELTVQITVPQNDLQLRLD